MSICGGDSSPDPHTRGLPEPGGETALLVVCGWGRAGVLSRGCHLFPPVRPAHHFPDLRLGQVWVGSGGVRLDALKQFLVVLASEVDLAVRWIDAVERAHRTPSSLNDYALDLASTT